MEGLATIRAAPHAVDGSGKHDLRVFRMHKERMGLQMRQNMRPVSACDVTPENPDATLLIRTPDIAGHAGADIRLVFHETFSLSLFQAHKLGHPEHCRYRGGA